MASSQHVAPLHDEDSQPVDDLDDDILRLRESLENLPSDDPTRAVQLHDLGVRVLERSTATASTVENDQAIQILQEALNLSQQAGSSTIAAARGLARAYVEKFNKTGTMAYIVEAIQLYEGSISSEHMDARSRSQGLSQLGTAYRSKYQRSGATPDIDMAIEKYKEALSLIADNNQHQQAYLLYYLGLSYQCRYQETWTISDMSTANELLQESLDMIPRSSPTKGYRRYALALGHQILYQRTGKEADINKAIQLFQENMDEALMGDLSRENSLQHLGNAYHVKYRTTGMLCDLDRSIALLQESVDACRHNGSESFLQLEDLGCVYRQRFQKTQSRADIQKALDLLQEAYDATPQDAAVKATHLQILSYAYYEKYMVMSDTADIDKAIELARDTLRITKQGELPRGKRLYNLALFHGSRYRGTGSRVDLQWAIRLYEHVLNAPRFDLIIRLWSGHHAFHHHAEVEDWAQAYEAARKVVHLIPFLTPRYHDVADMQYVLSDAAGIACDAAALALQAGHGTLAALEILERGRSVLATMIEDLRMDLSQLVESHPQLMDDFNGVRNQLDSLAIGDEDSDSAAERSRMSSYETHVRTSQRYDASIKFADLVEQIHKTSGLEGLLDVPSESEMCAAATNQPIVIINVSEYRCDAILIESSQIRSLALPSLHKEDLKDKASKGNVGGESTLGWLWDVALSPILDALGLTHAPNNDVWPHVWWIPTGIISTFPLHAAGHHRNQAGASVLDRVMSSYSQSVKTLIQSRRRRLREHCHLPPARARALMVAMESTPGASDLPFATKEIKMLQDVYQSMGLDCVEPGKRRQDVMLHLPGSTIFHFAGHGYTDDRDPLKSHLLLGDHHDAKTPLAVATLLGMNLRKDPPFLAYLSACGTGQVKDGRFFDESIHLISACQLAGFRHVIGTLWEVRDAICIDMAMITCEGLRDGGMTDESVCHGLHKASRELRSRWLETSPSEKRFAEANYTEAFESCNDGQEYQRSGDSTRHYDLQSDEHDAPLQWVAWVHFGV